MTQDLLRTDAYLAECVATVTTITPRVIVPKIEKKSASIPRVVLSFTP